MQVVARTDMLDPETIAVNRQTTILQTPGGTYHVHVAAADSTGVVLAYVLAGLRIDDRFAAELKGNGHADVVISGETRLGAAGEDASKLPWQTRTDWEQLVGAESSPRTFDANGETYQAAGTFLGGSEGSGPLVAVIQSYDDAIAPYRWIQVGLIVLGAIAAVVGVSTSALLARNITAPVAKLVEGTQQVAAGNFDYRLDVRSADEIGDLAGSFNTMIQGLRERADMQKFVSASTVEMIQSAANKKTSAGEKVVLTVLFSDMRGFTPMTEHKTPEETVKLLNACLSLQAAKVKKFHGDIDKYVGDCVVALFSGDDMELNAIRCAVETHAALDEMNSKNLHDTPIRVGIGIVTGEVILGSIGSEDRLDYTVIGSNVNLCSRLCSNASPGETLIAESTYRKVQGLVAAQRGEPLRVKGFTDAIQVYRMG
jgi:adenylate cyclase